MLNIHMDEFLKEVNGLIMTREGVEDYWSELSMGTKVTSVQ